MKYKDFVKYREELIKQIELVFEKYEEEIGPLSELDWFSSADSDVTKCACETCDFWTGRFQDQGSSLEGECRAEPPQSNAYAVWPTTQHDDWCGAYKPHSDV